jgi:hypothetical protein
VLQLPLSLNVLDILLTHASLHLCEFPRKLTLLNHSCKILFLFLFEALGFLFLNDDSLVRLEV